MTKISELPVIERNVLQSNLSNLERKTGELVGPNRLSMICLNPDEQLTLATLARVVTLLISARAHYPSTEVKTVANQTNFSNLSLDELLRLRQKMV